MRTFLLVAFACSAFAATTPDAAAKRIDELVAKGLSEHQLKANADCSDDVFARRIYLDCLGRIPTLAEYLAFKNDAAPAKRQSLIAKLLGSVGRVSHDFNYWADLLRAKSQLTQNMPGETYIDWLKQALRDNMPYDQMVSSLITAHGRTIDDGNGATGYYMRDFGMPQDNMSNTVQLFLGTRLACAQCHDHPFDKWSRLDYLQMAAFTNGVKERPNEAFIRTLRQAARSDGEVSKEEMQAFRRIAQIFGMEVQPTKQATIALPKDYQYANGKPGQVVNAHALFDSSVTVKKGQDPQEVYAAWLTSRDNPRFTLVIANRLWKRTMGAGLIEPVDNIVDSTVASNPELMDYLVSLMKDLRYDMRAYREILFATKTYQRACSTGDVVDGETYYFQGPKLRRMRAEQVWDSLLTLAVPDLDERKGNPRENPLMARYEDLKGKPPSELAAAAKELLDEQRKRKEFQQKIAELEKSGMTRKQIFQDPKYRDLRDQMMAMGGPGGGKRKEANEPDPDPRWAKFRRQLVRASELQSPAPPEHFLRVYGQSDRELIDNGNDSPAITQALFLSNGLVDQELLQPYTVLMQSLKGPKTIDKIHAIYESVLGRLPSDEELEVLRPMKLPEPELLATIVWSLVNSNEFIFIQ